MDLFAPSHIVILLVVILVLFGAKRLPGAAKALGQSMHIFKKSVQGLDDGQPIDGSTSTQVTAVPPPAAAQPLTGQPAAQAPDATQQELQDIQRRLQELQRQTAGGSGPTSGAAGSDTPRDQQSY